MTTPTIRLSAAETALRNLSSTITRDDETISLLAALDALRGVAGKRGEVLDTIIDDMNCTVAIAHALEDGAIADAWAWVFEDALKSQNAALTIYRPKRGQNHE